MADPKGRQWVAGTVLQISSVSITVGQRTLFCVRLYVYISNYTVKESTVRQDRQN